MDNHDNHNEIITSIDKYIDNIFVLLNALKKNNMNDVKEHNTLNFDNLNTKEEFNTWYNNLHLC